MGFSSRAMAKWRVPSPARAAAARAAACRGPFCGGPGPLARRAPAVPAELPPGHAGQQRDQGQVGGADVRKGRQGRPFRARPVSPLGVPRRAQ